MKLFQVLINLVKKYGIEASKIALTALIILNLIAGNEINLTTKDINIASNYFNVDKNGKITLKDNGVESGVLNILGSNFNSSIRSFGAIFEGPNGYVGIEADYAFAGGSIKVAPSQDETLNYTLIQDGKIEANTYQVRNEGSVMYGKGEGHKYRCHWNNANLQFWVDETNVGTLSDKRLKTEIKEIDNDFIEAIKEIEMKQFKVANRNGLISFGILAQDLIEIFKKYNKNPLDYEIVQETQYRTDDDTIYYTINYEQFLILKTKAQELEINELQERDKQKDETIQSLTKRIEKLEANN